MLHASDELRRMTIHAVDGEIGRVHEFYFDDESWTLKYFIVHTGGWRSGREVLLQPAHIKSVDWAHHQLVVGLTVEQVRNCPDASSDQRFSVFGSSIDSCVTTSRMIGVRAESLWRQVRSGR